MKRLAVISGKGGTGKTMVTAALAHLLQGHLVIADCDVDAANLALTMRGRLRIKDDYKGAFKAVIDERLCVECGRCEVNCVFGAISEFQVIDSRRPVSVMLVKAVVTDSAVDWRGFGTRLIALVP